MIYARSDQSVVAVLQDAATGLIGTLGVRIENSDGSNHTPRTTSGIVELEPGAGVYAATLTAPDNRGTYVVLWDDGGLTPQFASEELSVVSSPPTPLEDPEDVLDLRDTRVLIPRVRRALEGPAAISGSAAIAAGDLSDDQINASIADAIADVIFYSGGLFGHALNVEARDIDYLAPIAWTVDPQLTEAEATVIVAQAALNYFFNWAKGMKVSQEITDEGQTWKYSLSAQLLTDQIRMLRDARDRALDQLAFEGNAANDAWINTIQIRDAQTSAIIEPWAAGGGMGGQQFDGDARFGTWV